MAALVDADWYLDTYREVAAAGHDPAAHFLKYGMAEGKKPNALFDPDWYVATYPEVGRRKNALRDYVRSGSKRGRRPGPLFDPVAYLAGNPDVARTGAEPLLHFLRHGRAEGRSPNGWPRAGRPGAASLARRGLGRSGSFVPADEGCSILRRPAAELHPAVVVLRQETERRLALFQARDAIMADMLDQPAQDGSSVMPIDPKQPRSGA